ncbi:MULTISPECIES: CoxG family protein [unclassified Phyllobacterium]|uniref:CoxG family protein n=1 Tax=unclassified Phyllobacterium TaxID=2638441 RepID=UPI003012D3D4
MDLTGEERIAANRATVWNALNNPDILKACIPGCEQLEWVSETELAATLAVRLGVIKPRFSGAIYLSNLNPPFSYTISCEGKGSIAGIAKGGADVALVEDGNETRLIYTVNAQVGGKIAKFGSGLIASTASKIATRFFEKFNEAVSAA